MTTEQAKQIISEATKSILEQQRVKGVVPSWDQKAHCYMLRSAVLAAIAITTDEKEQRAAVAQVLIEGCAGNASQYRQRLEKDKQITKQAVITDEYQ